MSRSLLAVTTLFVSAVASAQASDPRFQVRAVLPLTGQLQQREVFRVDNASGFFAAGMLGVGTIPISGKGERTMWHPFRAGFRTGGVSADQWDEANYGFYSFATGSDTIASGNWTHALGYATKATGSYSTAIGYRSEANATSSFALGYYVEADADYSIALGNRVSSNGFKGSFVWGDSNASGTDFTTMFANTANNEFAIRASGGVRLRTNGTWNTGCNLAAGGGVWSCTSDRHTKENFRSEDPESVLAKLVKLQVTSWNFKTEDKASRHIGPMAQDFYAAFKLGNDEKTIGHTDLTGVNMLAIQALEKRSVKQAARISELEAELKALREENRALRAEREEVGARLDRIEQLVMKNGAKPEKQLSKR